MENKQMKTILTALSAAVLGLNVILICMAISVLGQLGSVPSAASTCTAMIILLVLLLAAAVAVGVFVVRRVSRPMSEIADSARRAAEGDLNVDELPQMTENSGPLAAEFNKIVRQLHDYGDYIEEITGVLNQIAAGDLDFQLQYKYEGVFSGVKAALENLSASLNDTMGKINRAADQVSGNASQVATGAQALSEGATEQAASIEELAATISGISKNVKSNAEKSHEMETTVDGVTARIEDSNRQMQEMMSAMDDISNTSSKISKIIKTIEDIAFQTNILALNAAVEAAHAGEAGKGFAVVADEVRSLASKSSEASNSTSQLIQTSLDAVERGSRIASETAKSLVDVVEGAKGINTGIGLIAQSTNEQSTALEQVTLGVDQISDVIQTNTATSEEAASASDELSRQAQLMKEMVAKFKLSNSSRAPKAAVQKSARPAAVSAPRRDIYSSSSSPAAPKPAPAEEEEYSVDASEVSQASLQKHDKYF